VDIRQALLDARVAEAADAWLIDPQDTAVYSRLVAAVAERRRYLRRTSAAGGDEEAAATVGRTAVDADPDHPPAEGAHAGAGASEQRSAGDRSVDEEQRSVDEEQRSVDEEQRSVDEEQRSVEEGSVEEGSVEEGSTEEPSSAEPSWPAVRSVGADLVGDPAAVLRRLREG
jgi:hypothetical protein